MDTHIDEWDVITASTKSRENGRPLDNFHKSGENREPIIQYTERDDAYDRNSVVQPGRAAQQVLD